MSKKFDGFEVVLWDTAGQECFKSLNRLYYRDVKACVLVTDVTKKSDFSSLDKWLQEFLENSNIKKSNYEYSVCFSIIVNKIDLC